MAYDPNKDKIHQDLGTFNIDESKWFLAQVVSYNGGEKKVSVAKKVTGRKGTQTYNVGRFSRDEARALLSLLADVVDSPQVWE